MQVTFGLHLDARQGPSTRDYFNTPAVGRLGFLSLLETYLGLSAIELHAANRVAVYLGLLQQVDDGKRFYSQSLKVDSVGTAARLLSWRDEWRMGGWNGNALATTPRRISELALVEAVAKDTLPPGEAERLIAVAAALQNGEPTPIASVLLVEQLDEFPWAWREVLTRLPNVSSAPLTPQGQGQLRQLQERALKAVVSGEFNLQDVTDGSVQLVRTQSLQVAENWLSVHHANSPADRLVVAEDFGDSVDTTLAATGGANCGFESHRHLRPALQALGLAIELCWGPVEVPRLIDFLTHPIGPFSRSARSRLASAVAEQPGIGGQAWEDAKASIVAGKDGKELGEEIDFWLEGQRWPRDEGAPIEDLRVRADRLSAALSKRLTGDPADAATFMPAYQQCRAVSDSLAELQRHGVTKVLPRDIEQLIAQATSAGAVNPAAASQVSCMRSVRITGACVDAAEEVVWWMPASPRLPSQLPWSEAEAKALAELGVALRDPAKELAGLSLHWLRPLLAAKSRFVMVLPPPGAEEHPMLQLLLRLSPQLKDSTLDLESALASTFQGSLAETVTPIAFAEVPRLIQMPAPLPMPGDPHSYTSLSELFNSPALFALRRIGHLKPTRLLAAEEDNKLLGTLAHRVFERLFADPAALAWSNAQALEWFRANIGDLLRTEGAVLLMQGAGVSEQRFRSVCEHAITALLNHLRSAGAVSVRTEVEFSGVLGDIALTGKVDLVVELPDGRRVALDMKWHGESRFSDVLTEGNHLQLALYSTLIEQNLGAAPVALGYFILDCASLLISAPGIFPQAHLRQPKQGRSVHELLQMAKQTWDWRVGQLNAGVVEVVPIKPSDEFNGPPGTLAVEGPKRWDADRLVLLGGWEQ